MLTAAFFAGNSAGAQPAAGKALKIKTNKSFIFIRLHFNLSLNASLRCSNSQARRFKDAASTEATLRQAPLQITEYETGQNAKRETATKSYLRLSASICEIDHYVSSQPDREASAARRSWVLVSRGSMRGVSRIVGADRVYLFGQSIIAAARGLSACGSATAN